MITQADLTSILENARVPEHSVRFMGAMSAGQPFVEDSYLFIAAEDWLLAIGYPLQGDYQPDEFEASLSQALQRTGARECWAICSGLPSRLKAHRCDEDCYYTLPVDAPIPARLQRLAQRAAGSLKVEEGGTFTAAHRKLWAEFLVRKNLPANIRELYARTETVLNHVPSLSLLNAWDADGNLAACLLLDSAPRRFCSYLLGAHSRSHYTPYAFDLLFCEMIVRAAKAGKDYLHLGLGVNEGIRRFKVKWGATPTLPYEMARWKEKEGALEGSRLVMQMLASMPRETISKEQYMASLPRQRRFRMLWDIEKDGHRSWIGGTAHFFCYSFENSMRKLFDNVDTVLFEGPLDPDSLSQVSAAGHKPDPQAPRLIDALSATEIESLKRVVCGPQGFWASFMGTRSPNPPDVDYFLSRTRPWMAFFSLWTAFLARMDWDQSVDLEAWNIAHDMGKTVGTMETIPEQIETLNSITLKRITNFLRQCRSWKQYIRRFERFYLKGELEQLYGTSVEFPTRSGHVIQRRDAIFLEKMRPHLEKGRCAIFVGSAHMINLRDMIAAAGFTIRRSR